MIRGAFVGDTRLTCKLALQGNIELFVGNLTSVNKILTYNGIAATALGFRRF